MERLVTCLRPCPLPSVSVDVLSLNFALLLFSISFHVDPFCYRFLHKCLCGYLP